LRDKLQHELFGRDLCREFGLHRWRGSQHRGSVGFRDRVAIAAFRSLAERRQQDKADE